jgi:hypothetical protein
VILINVELTSCTRDVVVVVVAIAIDQHGFAFDRVAV